MNAFNGSCPVKKLFHKLHEKCPKFFSGSYSGIPTEYGEISLRIQSDCGKIRKKCWPEQLRIRTLFTQCVALKFWASWNVAYDWKHEHKWTFQQKVFYGLVRCFIFVSFLLMLFSFLSEFFLPFNISKSAIIFLYLHTRW